MGIPRRHLKGLLKGQKLASPLEERFDRIWAELDGPKMAKELLLIPGRKFRFDRTHLKAGVVIEIDGGVFMRRSRHTSPKGFIRDVDKLNLVVLLGFIPFRLTAPQINREYMLPIVNFVKARLK